MRTSTPATTVPHTTHRIERQPLAPSHAARPDPVIRYFAFLMFLRGMIGLAIAGFFILSGPTGIALAGIFILCSAPSLVLAIGLVKMKAWARSIVAVFELLGMALVVLSLIASQGSPNPVAMVQLLYSFMLVAWLVYRWDRFR